MAGARGARSRHLLAVVLLLAAGLFRPAAAAAEAEAVARGAYLVHAAGCVACHSDTKNKGPELAGGRALPTPFGTFYTPNITPHPEDGIGAWSAEDFVAALRHGRRPDGAAYYPAFPYPSYAGMREADARDLFAYLQSLEPVARRNREHDLAFPFSLRLAARAWRLLFFTQREFEPDPGRDEAWNRGAYLVRHLGHCGECHSPRGTFGEIDEDQALADVRIAAEPGQRESKIPNITPHPDDGIGDWNGRDLAYFLQSGFLPDGDFVGGEMEEVISLGTSKLTNEDRAAMSGYLLSLPPLPGP